MKIKLGAIFYIAVVFLFWSQRTNSQTIEKENISNAEKIIGLEFTDAERDSMIEFLDEQLGEL